MTVAERDFLIKLIFVQVKKCFKVSHLCFNNFAFNFVFLFPYFPDMKKLEKSYFIVTGHI